MCLVDLDSGDIVCHHTDELPGSVGGSTLYKYLEEHPKSKFAFIYNHNNATEMSLADVELMENNVQLETVEAVRNDGIITLTETNGKHSNDFMSLRYDEQRTRYRQEHYGYRVPHKMAQHYNIEIEVFTRDLVIQDFAKGVMKEYE